MQKYEINGVGNPNWPNMTAADLMMMEVRQFAVGLHDHKRPSKETVALAERLVSAAYQYTVEPDIDCYDDGFLGYIMEMPNGSIVIVTLDPDGGLLFANHNLQEPDVGPSALHPSTEHDVVSYLSDPDQSRMHGSQPSLLKGDAEDWCEQHVQLLRDADAMIARYLEAHPRMREDCSD